jgi:oxygen-independent coproporphyrinogen-3 oxidase
MYIYLHVPFCQSRCIYCDFFVVLDKEGGQAAYVDALCREIALRFDTLDLKRWPEGIRSFYVGGGTPSLLPAADYARIFKTLNAYLAFHPKAEITLEANPGADRSEIADAPEAYRAVGFNRISVGVQSFNDAELKKLSRIHSAAEAEAFVRQLQKTGWNNISIDLMYGLPLQTMASWEETLDRAIALEVQHISMYGLKVEEGTALKTLTTLSPAAKGYALPNDDVNVGMYFEGLRRLQQAGFERYEFSNLAKPGYASQHNLNYWSNGEFMALGASAHGYLNGVRYETVPDMSAYLENPLAGKTHVCSSQEQLENAIIFGLRKAEGIHIPALEREHGIDFGKRYWRIMEKYRGDFLEILENNRLVLTERAIPLSNTILAEFLDG